MGTTPPKPPTLRSTQPVEAPPQGGTDQPPPDRAKDTSPRAYPAQDGYLTREQITVLLKDISRSRVAVMDGMSHVEAWDIRAHLNRIFGFARWSADVLDMTMLYEDRIGADDKPRWRCGYRCTLRLTVCAPDGTPLATYTETAGGDTMGTMPDGKRLEAHDMAIKTAESQALKRCAANLGTQFGLSLYRNGQTADVVRLTLVPDHIEGAGDE